MNQILTFSRIQSLTNGQWLSLPQHPEQTIRGGAFDTRHLGDAEIFFAWKGEQSDGHAYLQHLAGSGIKLAIVEKDVSVPEGPAVLKVSSSLQALHQLAAWLVEGFNGSVVTITGSSGKTTTKTWLTHILRDHFDLLSNPGSFNNQIGCPMTILSLSEEHELLLLEMGTSGPGELDLLSRIAPADIAVLLNVGHAHLGKFGSLENIYRAKTEIFHYRRNHALAVVPFGDKRLKPYLPTGRICYFGQQAPAFSYQIDHVDSRHLSQTIRFETPEGSESVTVNHPGRYVGELLSAALAVCYHLGLGWRDVKPQLSSLPQEKGRATFVTGINGALLLDDTYNANPESMINMLDTICALEMEQCIGVVGNLAELEQDMRESAGFIVSRLPKKLTALILSGDSARILVPAIQAQRPDLRVIRADAVTEIIDQLRPNLTSQTVVGIKGSRSAHMERVLLGLTGQGFNCLLERCTRLNRCDICELRYGKDESGPS